jgi:predicted SAM-dependent methyltransferase
MLKYNYINLKKKLMKNYHIGCGYVIGKNWLNYDSSLIAFIDQIPILNKINQINDLKFPKNILYGNIVKKKLCNNNFADNIYCSHVLEHVSYLDAKKVLKNIYDMLKRDGVFRIVVPSLKSRVENYNVDNDANKFMESLGCVNKNENLDIISKLRFLFGGSRHRWMYDDESLKNELTEAGFINIRKCEFGDSGSEIFSEVEDEDRFHSKSGKFKEIAFHCLK